MDATNLLTPIEAGTLVALSASRVTRLARRGLMPAVFLPDGEIRFSQADLAEWIDAHRRPAELQGGQADAD